MAASYRYEGDECKCGHGRPPVARVGVYTGLCEIGREAKREELSQIQKDSRAARAGRPRAASSNGATPMARDREGPIQLPSLAKTIQTLLVPAARDLEAAIEQREHARMRSRASTAAFNEALREVTRVGRSLIQRQHAIEADARTDGPTARIEHAPV